MNPGAKFGLICVYSEHSGVNSRALLACRSSLAWAVHPTESGVQQAPKFPPCFPGEDVLLHPSHSLSPGKDLRAFPHLLLPGCAHPALLPPHLPPAPAFSTATLPQPSLFPNPCSSGSGSWWEHSPLPSHLKSGFWGSPTPAKSTSPSLAITAAPHFISTRHVYKWQDNIFRFQFGFPGQPLSEALRKFREDKVI